MADIKEDMQEEVGDMILVGDFQEMDKEVLAAVMSCR